jgi:saccharopine dehydrogenase-like NADP-dependent oxidoreductase
MKRVLVLGAGLVVKPLLEDLLAAPDVELCLATLNVDRARALLADCPRAEALAINAADEAQLCPEVSRADAVISLLPADQHVIIAKACLDYRVPLVTTSYVSDGMRALDAHARERGVLLLNETGLDPGIDHMTAVEVINRVRRQGGSVLGSVSYCGGVPAPESNTNPWGYKFAWSPRGVVLAARNPVRFLEGGNIVEHPFPDLFDAPRFLKVPGVGFFEAYPNRDCLRYRKAYDLAGDDVQDFYRGTLRYPGWCQTWQALFELNLLDLTPQDWSGLTCAQALDRHLPPGSGSRVARLAERLDIPEDHSIIVRLEYIGLLSGQPVPPGVTCPLDLITELLQRTLSYQPDEHDMVVLEHRLTVLRGDGNLHRVIMRLVLSGPAGDDSAMARTVSLPAAVATRLILDRKIDLTGVHIPVHAQLASPILEGLRERGISQEETEEEIAPVGAEASNSGQS